MLYSVAVDHFVQVALVIKRGASHADTSLNNVKQIAHCQICDGWAILANTNLLGRPSYNITVLTVNFNTFVYPFYHGFQSQQRTHSTSIYIVIVMQRIQE